MKWDTESFINRCRELYSGLDYSKVEYINNRRHVTITCEVHGDFRIHPFTMLEGRGGCGKCKKEAEYIKRFVTDRDFDSQQDLINHVLNKKHKGMYSLCVGEYTSLTTPVKAVCKEHGEFTTTINCLFKNAPCPCCRSDAMFKKLVDKFTKKFDGKYTYKEYFSSDKIVVVCPKHGEQIQYRSNHSKALIGCIECAKEVGYPLTREEFIERCVAVHGDKYDYSLVNYISARDNVDILCKEHGKFSQMATNHQSGNGCPLCAESWFHHNKPTWFYIQKLEPYGGGEVFGKFGVSNRKPERRLRGQSRKSKFNHTLYFKQYYEKGDFPRALELFIKQNICSVRATKSDMPDGYSETFLWDDLNKLLELKTQYEAEHC